MCATCFLKSYKKQQYQQQQAYPVIRKDQSRQQQYGKFFHDSKHKRLFIHLNILYEFDVIILIGKLIITNLWILDWINLASFYLNIIGFILKAKKNNKILKK